MKAICLILVVLAAASHGAAETVVVDAQGGGDTADLQEAIDSCTGGGTVIVRPGTYVLLEPLDFNRAVPDDTLQPRSVKNLSVLAECGAAVTIIRMSARPRLAGRASLVVFRSGEDRRSLLEGFTITGGWGTESGGRTRGGGIAVENGSAPVIRNCRITANAADDGSAVWCSGADPLLERCAVTACATTSEGGAVSCRDGGRIVLEGCVVSSNRGAGLDAGPGCSMACVGTVIRANGGGAVLADSASVTLGNCVVSGNVGGPRGSVVLSRSSSVTLSNCTVAGNLGVAVQCEGFPAPNLLNSVFWGDRQGPVCGRVAFCLTKEDPLFVGEGRFDYNRFTTILIGTVTYELPDFVLEPPDYRLRAGSPAVDAGSSDGAPLEDIERGPRPCGAAVDIGAYETGCGIRTAWFRRGDTNADGQTNIADPIVLLRYVFQGEAAPPCLDAADVDDSGALDITDAVRTLNYLFLSGPAPAAPRCECGPDTEPDDGLTCKSFPPCAGP